ncbi:MAG: pyrroloquinoline quinone biosynthesis protein [Geobacteraceae bacterium GWC2_53_11]|nr:MAG: pyrroloquinoline quinone biosynthesis protein [Geobacteraceae bacterium GWC2_53_11]
MTTARITSDSTISQIEDIVASDIDNEKVMMSIEKGQYFGLEPTGSRIWEMIETPVRVSVLIDTLTGQYDVDRETCERDLLAFIGELDEAGIIQVHA